MPCNQLAVATGRLATDVAQAVTGSAEVIEAVRRLMASTLGVETEAVTVYNEIHGWGLGWNQYRNHQPVTQPVPLARLMGSRELVWVANRLAVQLDSRGELTFRDGWNLGNPLQGEALAAFQVQFEALIGQLVQALAQEQMVAAIQQVATITSDQWQPSGARVLKVQV